MWMDQTIERGNAKLRQIEQEVRAVEKAKKESRYQTVVEDLTAVINKMEYILQLTEKLEGK